MLRLLLPLLLLALPVFAAEKSINAQSFVRDVGYRVGDVVQQRVEVITPEGYLLDESSLPKKLGAGAHIELRNVAIQTSESAEKVKHVLNFEWQVFRTLRDVRVIPLRTLELNFRKGDEVLVARLQAAEILMAPMLPTMLTKEQATPREAIEPQPQAWQPILQQFGLAIAGLLITALYFAWRFDYLPFLGKRTSPFRQAARDIRRTRKSSADTANVQSAMRILSRAFNTYAKASVTYESLSPLFASHPELHGQQREIEQFFMATQQVFFAGKTDAMTQVQVEKLARQLSLLETP
ncbi:hypothetical protein LG201_00425 [Methylobacillus gramineus]|uniref:hypothetical protein n=1 Tax=Methylobacillus gramineus TaxID=755169 RepID=UPI001CFF8A2A|nr:hypothetical protein [Methylobacillus gramineus]MCB5183670.1 hypothetical protein [Methylobacillus gramineus]